MAQWLEQSGASSVVGILAYNRRTRLIVACATAFFWLIFVLLLVDALVSSDTQPGDYWLLALPLFYAVPASVWAWQMSRPAVLTPTELIAPRFIFGARRVPVAAIDDVQIRYVGRGRRGIKLTVSGKTHLLWPTETVTAMRRQKRDTARGSKIPIESAASAIRAASTQAKQPRT